VEELIKRCPNGLYAEIKYDGERLQAYNASFSSYFTFFEQVHKQGDNFSFFSRNLKSVLPWKVEPVKKFVMQATTAHSIILDGEILLMDTETRKPLPFGTLGIHKKTQVSNFDHRTMKFIIFLCSSKMPPCAYFSSIF
jgi:DNA ligase-3